MEIKNRYTLKVLFKSEKTTIKDAVIDAVKEDAYLGGANLRGADLGGAYLRGANLRDADLGGADLGGANLRGAYLGDADLGGAYLRGADLRDADLGDAYLRGAYLRGADLGGAYLRRADLGGAKNYHSNHDVLFEAIRRISIEEVTKTEWEIIGQLTIHRFCWGWIMKQSKAPVMRMLKRLADIGFTEYLAKYKETNIDR